MAEWTDTDFVAGRLYDLPPALDGKPCAFGCGADAEHVLALSKEPISHGGGWTETIAATRVCCWFCGQAELQRRGLPME